MRKRPDIGGLNVSLDEARQGDMRMSLRKTSEYGEVSVEEALKLLKSSTRASLSWKRRAESASTAETRLWRRKRVLSLSFFRITGALCPAA
jgi:hypothetical protein